MGKGNKSPQLNASQPNVLHPLTFDTDLLGRLTLVSRYLLSHRHAVGANVKILCLKP
jgi:hypothetical protein